MQRDGSDAARVERRQLPVVLRRNVLERGALAPQLARPPSRIRLSGRGLVRLAERDVAAARTCVWCLVLRAGVWVDTPVRAVTGGTGFRRFAGGAAASSSAAASAAAAAAHRAR